MCFINTLASWFPKLPKDFSLSVPNRSLTVIGIGYENDQKKKKSRTEKGQRKKNTRKWQQVAANIINTVKNTETH